MMKRKLEEQNKRAFSAILVQMSNEDGISQGCVVGLLNSIGSQIGYDTDIIPLTIEGEQSWCFGFIDFKDFDEKMNFDSSNDSAFAVAVRGILDNKNHERDDCLYQCAGIPTKITYTI